MTREREKFIGKYKYSKIYSAILANMCYVTGVA
jgi:hypothetical protein